MEAIASAFELILVILTISSLLIVLLNKYLLSKYPKEKEGWLADYAKSLLPVFFIVLIIRSFLFEPFKIPSGSMLPTLRVGDFIFVNKFAYDVKWPIFWKHKIFKMGNPKRGDIVVFRWPVNPNVNFIKRLVGMPGDHISYINKRLSINGKVMPKKLVGSVYDSYLNKEYGFNEQKVNEYITQNGDITHKIYNFPWAPNMPADFKDFVVPSGHYFFMGDDRDGSEDSRYWGVVPEDHLVGKAVMIWMSVGDNYMPRWSRIGHILTGSDVKALEIDKNKNISKKTG